MKKIRTGLMIAAFTTVIGSTATFAQEGTSTTNSGNQGAGAGAEMGSGQSDRGTSKAAWIGLLGLFGLMGLKHRHNVRHVEDRV